jgi:hypothetical protein
VGTFVLEFEYLLGGYIGIDPERLLLILGFERGRMRNREWGLRVGELLWWISFFASSSPSSSFPALSCSSSL